MRFKLELIHETQGLCITEIAHSEVNKENIIAAWRKKYGKTIDKCKIVCKNISHSKLGRKGCPVIYKPTGERYVSAYAASLDLKVHATTVSNHCKREGDSSFENKFRWA